MSGALIIVTVLAGFCAVVLGVLVAGIVREVRWSRTLKDLYRAQGARREEEM